jgi:hypothetical protein
MCAEVCSQIKRIIPISSRFSKAEASPFILPLAALLCRLSDWNLAKEDRLAQEVEPFGVVR